MREVRTTRSQTDGIDNLIKEDKEYWRPSYMVHWLRAVGKSINVADEAFDEYKGRASYEELGLKCPEPLPQDDEYAEDWSHMSEYDST